MSMGEAVVLVLIIAAFATFGATLGWLSHHQRSDGASLRLRIPAFARPQSDAKIAIIVCDNIGYGNKSGPTLERSWRHGECLTRDRKHRNLARCTIDPQRIGSEEALLIRCRISSSEREVNPTGPDSSSKNMRLESPNPDASTKARKFCCWILADSANGESVPQPLVGISTVRPRCVTRAIQIERTML